MPIRATCPSCARSYVMADRLAGKQVRCKGCSATFKAEDAPTARPSAPEPEALEEVIAVPEATPPSRSRSRDEEDAPPMRRRRAFRGDEDEPEDRPRGQGATPLLLIGGGAALLLLLVVGGVVAFFVLRRPAADPTPTANNGDKDAQKDANKDAKKEANKDGKPPPKIVHAPRPTWAVGPDPSREKADFPDDHTFTLPLSSQYAKFTYPTTPSRFVALNQNAGSRTPLAVFDLAAGKQVGQGAEGRTRDLALSPDGALLAGRDGDITRTAVKVWSTRTGKAVKGVIVDNKYVGLRLVDFAEPVRLVTVKNLGSAEAFQVWDLKAGSLVCQFQTPSTSGSDRARAFSPGRRYYAFFNDRSQSLVVHDLRTGARVGESSPGGAARQGLALAFSPDGKKAAGLFRVGAEFRLSVWDVAAGKLAADVNCTRALKGKADTSSDRAAPLVWSADGRALSAWGKLLLEPTTGQLALTLSVGRAGNRGDPRRLLGTHHFARIKPASADRFSTKYEFVVAPLGRDKLAAALDAAREGKDPAVAQLPALRPADWSAAKRIAPPAGDVPYKAAVEASPKGAGAGPVPLPVQPPDLAALLFSGPKTARVAALSLRRGEGTGAQTGLRYDAYSLAGGKPVAGASLYSFDAPAARPGSRRLDLLADLSPAADALLVRHPADGKRLDVWDGAGKHLAAWAPYEKEPDQAVQWAGLLDANRALTLNKGGKLVLWQLPACKALYVAEGYKGRPVFSPGRSLLAAHNGSAFDLLRAEDGQTVGQLPAPGLGDVGLAAFRADGKEFAALATGAAGTSLSRWDTASGRRLGDLPARTAYRQAALCYCGDGYLLVGTVLYDLRAKLPVISYPGVTAAQFAPSPDGRQWAATRAGGDGATLRPLPLPGAAAEQISRALANGTMTPALPPGSVVAVQVNGAGTPDVHGEAAGGLATLLRLRGFKTEGAPSATLRISIQAERPTGRLRRLESIGADKKRVDVPVVEVAIEAELSDARGKLWSTSRKEQTPEVLGLIDGTDPAGELKRRLWKNVASAAGSVDLPTLLVRTPGGVETLPKSVPFPRP